MALPEAPQADRERPVRPERPDREGGRPPREGRGGEGRGEGRGDRGPGRGEARADDRGGPGGPAARRKGGPRRRLRKPCPFCKEGPVDYKQAERLKRFLSDRGKIMARRATGCCARHQRELTVALKRARFMALLPYVVV